MTISAWFEVCDEIRHEANGKQIRVGQYTGDIVFPKLPNELPLLVLSVSIRFPLEFTPTSVNIRVVRPGMAEYTRDVPSSILENSPSFNPSDPPPFRTLRTLVPLRPCRFVEPGRMRVFVLINGTEEVNAGSILVRSAQADMRQKAEPDPFVVALANTLKLRGSIKSKALERLCSTYVEAYRWAAGPFKTDDIEVINMPVGEGRIRSVLTKPLPGDPDKVVISDLDDGLTAEVVSFDRYGATIQVTPPNDPVNLTVEYHVGNKVIA